MTQLTFSLEEPLASRSALPASEPGWLTLEATSPLRSLGSLTDIDPGGWSGKMYPAFCHPTEDGILVPSSGRWQNSGMGSPIGFLTLSTSEWNHILAPSLNDDGVCSLSDILETGVVPRRYFLSAKACLGILRRAAKRGKELPPPLRRALEAVVEWARTSIWTVDS